MNTSNDRTVSKRTAAKWANTKDVASKASSLHDTQKEAIDAVGKCLELRRWWRSDKRCRWNHSE